MDVLSELRSVASNHKTEVANQIDLNTALEKVREYSNGTEWLLKTDLPKMLNAKSEALRHSANTLINGINSGKLTVLVGDRDETKCIPLEGGAKALIMLGRGYKNSDFPPCVLAHEVAHYEHLMENGQDDTREGKIATEIKALATEYTVYLETKKAGVNISSRNYEEALRLMQKGGVKSTVEFLAQMHVDYPEGLPK